MAVEHKSETLEVKEYQGKVLSTPIPYTFEWDEFTGEDGKASAVTAGAWPDAADAFILKSVNKGQKTAAKANAYNKAIAAEKERYEGTAEFKLAKGIKDILAMKPNMPLEQAEKLAKSLLELE
jgi:hypothetical protein